MPEFSYPQYQGWNTNYYNPINTTAKVELPISSMEHWLNIEEVVKQFNNDNLTDDNNTLFKAEIAFTSFKWTGVKHIPEMRPYEDWEQ